MHRTESSAPVATAAGAVQERAAAALGGLVAALSSATLAGWLLGADALRSPLVGTVAMNPSTALGLVVSALALLLAALRRDGDAARLVRTAAGGTAATIGALRLLGHLTPFDARVDTWFASAAEVERAAAARMGAATALALVLTGTGSALLAGSSARTLLLSQACFVGTASVGAIGLVAHALGASPLHGPTAFTTATCFVALGVGGLLLDPGRGLVAVVRSAGPGGVAARRLLPTVAAALLVAGALFSSLQRSGRLAGEVAMALLVIVGLAALAAAVGAVAVALERADAERRRAESELRASELRHRELFELVPLPAWVFDPETHRFLAVNRAALATYGYSREEFLALRLEDIRPTEEVGPLQAHLASLDEGATSTGLWRHRRRDGSLIEVEISAAPVTITDRPARIVVARDVTEERRLSAALVTSEGRFRALAETATDAIVSAGRDGRITFLNPAARAMFGLAGDAGIGRPLTVLMPERFHAAHERGFQRFLDTGEARVVGATVELVGRREDGGEFPVELSLASWGEGERLAFTGIVRDITRRKRAEEDLRRGAAELAAANAELDAFSYSVSHDLRAPLRSIDGFSQALLEDCADRLDATGRAHLGRVRAAAQRMAALIDDLLELARVSRSEMRRDAIDLAPIARSILDELRRREPHREVEAAIADELVVEGDPQLLRVALQNLLENAWKYTRPRARALVEVSRAASDGAPVFRVRDNGVGFDMAFAQKLFTPFQRLHAASEFEGTGIGLATVQRIVRRHGGRVWAEAEVGNGASFYFTL